ncbi:cardiolipin synthase [Halobacillus sp. SY10]|uniref:Cardiolipin synthase n=2 Tax=Halobacillus TaxID=45667 RepID=A0A1H0VDV7_HALAD|nr:MULTISPECIES: cardiolipin synthase [Halobacillus]RDY72342.1 cardiolipin synthase [Halobacillus trueperi]SDP76712.1 cardiolipin synthase [Halobacillus aidingensis]
MLVTIILFIILFILLLVLDFKWGRAKHRKNHRPIPLPETSGNYKLYKNGSVLYEQMFQEISEAKKQVDIYFYLIDNDYISENFLDVLKNKARNGVPVRLLVDRLGGYKINKSTRKKLKDAGVAFYFAETPGFPFFFYRLNRRNHRKITVIDGKVGYVGGFNIGKNYIGESAKFGDWRDYHLRLTGPVVSQIHKVMLDDWYLASGETLSPCQPSEDGNHKMNILATDGVELEKEFAKMIDSAQREILIGTPYFIPTDKLQKGLKQAIDRGVELHIMIPMKADHPFVKPAAIPYLKELYGKGATIRLFDAGFYHSKVVMVDETFADIGTANFDRRSFFLNKEVNTFVYDEEFIGDLRTAYFEDAADAIAFDEHWLKRRSFTTRLNQRIAVLLRPFL